MGQRLDSWPVACELAWHLAWSFTSYLAFIVGDGWGPRNVEFLKFVKTIDAQVPKGLDVHLSLDKYATHKHANVQWLLKPPGFICTSSPPPRRG